MLFSGIPFLYYFLPVVLALYFLSPRRLRNGTLLLASLFFYAWGEPRYVLLMLAVIALAYLSGLWLERLRGKRGAKAALCLSVLLNVAALGYFKYADFFLANFNAITGLSLPLLRLALPIGISFYTFQAMSYVIDVYRGDVPAQRDFVQLAVYVAMFPQLIAGPIVRYADIAAQLRSRTSGAAEAAAGIRRFVLGLGKKVLLANALGELCAAYQVSQEKSVLFVWLYAVAFTLQIYFDFSGYSDMAIGLGKIFGFTFPENFRYPYMAGSITEFWRRWHISLGAWFRDYVYIPLGGNRVSRARWLWNILLVWLLTGFWHGASWNFIVWGLWFAVLLVAEKWWLLRPLRRARVWNHCYVLLAVLLGFVLFNAADLGEGLATVAALFGAGGLPLTSAECVYYLRSYAVVLLAAAVGATSLPSRLLTAIQERSPAARRAQNLLEPLALCALLLLITAYLVDGAFNPFLYFRF